MGNVCSSRDENDLRQKDANKSPAAKAENVFKKVNKSKTLLDIIRYWTWVQDRIQNHPHVGSHGEHREDSKAEGTWEQEVVL